MTCRECNTEHCFTVDTPDLVSGVNLTMCQFSTRFPTSKRGNVKCYCLDYATHVGRKNLTTLMYGIINTVVTTLLKEFCYERKI